MKKRKRAGAWVGLLGLAVIAIGLAVALFGPGRRYQDKERAAADSARSAGVPPRAPAHDAGTDSPPFRSE